MASQGWLTHSLDRWTRASALRTRLRGFMGTLGVVAGLTVATTVVHPASVAEAHGNVDQAFATSPFAWDQICTGVGGFNGQTFTPTQNHIAAFDLFIDAISSAAAFSITAFPNTAHILATAPAINFPPGLKHLDLLTPVCLNPGQKYAILITSGAVCFRSVFGGGSYVGGNAVNWFGPEAPGVDIHFATYAAQAISAARIAFVSNRDGNQEIYVMNTDGTGQTRLTTHPARDFKPSVSPDGNKIAFVSDRDGNDEIYVMNVDGSGLTRLTTHPARDSEPSFSGGGCTIAFTSERDGNEEIYVMNADGSGQTRLTTNLARDYEPSFSGDGSKIAFVSNRDGNDEIYVMNADGSGQTRLTAVVANDLNPSFSPDGSKIAFTSTRDTNANIYVMQANGTNPTRLTDDPWRDMEPSFSLDGSKIVFMSNRDRDSTTTDQGQEAPDEIYVMNADGTNQTRLTTHLLARDTAPSWGGRGVSTPAGTNVAVSPADQTGETPVTLTFTSVNSGGDTSMTTSTSGAAPPTGFKLGEPPTFYEITTTAGFSGSVEVCMHYDDTDFGNESQLQLFHFESGQWVAVAQPSLDIGANLICGMVTSLSPFAVFEKATAPFQFSGFFAPIDNNGVLNQANAGQTIPIKWRVTDTAGVPIDDPASFVSVTSGTSDCAASTGSDQIEEYSVSSGLQSLGNGHWQFNWKTPKSYAGQCRIMRLNLKDQEGLPSTRTAKFQFK